MTKQKMQSETGDDSLVDYLENAPPPLPRQEPIGPPDVQPGDDDPVETDE
jgi:hypothetical protein